MIVTKTEFREMFGYNHASHVSHLIKTKAIVVNDSGMIDLEEPKNKKWVKSRKKELIQKDITQDEGQGSSKTTEAPEDASNIGTQVRLLNQKIEEQKKKATLLDLKIARETKTVVETEVLNKVLMTIFNTLFQNLTELPSIYVDDLVNIIKTSDAPKEQFVKFLTDKIVAQIKNSLDVAENAARKHYENF